MEEIQQARSRQAVSRVINARKPRRRVSLLDPIMGLDVRGKCLKDSREEVGQIQTNSNTNPIIGLNV